MSYQTKGSDYVEHRDQVGVGDSLTKRELIALHVLKAIVGSRPLGAAILHEQVTREAVKLADALVEELNSTS